MADVAERLLKKGSKVYIEGSLQTRKFTDASGQEKFSTEIILGQYRGELISLDARTGQSPDAGISGDSVPVDNTASNGWDASPAPEQAGGFDDEIPF